MIKGALYIFFTFVYIFIFFICSQVMECTLSAELLVGLCCILSFYLTRATKKTLERVFSNLFVKYFEVTTVPPLSCIIFPLFIIPMLLVNSLFDVGEHKTVIATVVDKDKSRLKNGGYSYDITLSYRRETVELSVESDVWQQYSIGDDVSLGIQRGAFGFYVIKSKHFYVIGDKFRSEWFQWPHL